MPTANMVAAQASMSGDTKLKNRRISTAVGEPS
jgi:hypothetical protein